MAYHDTRHATFGDVAKSALHGIWSIFASIGTGLVNAAEANQRLKTVERLQTKSDAELEALGIRREDIVRYVFRDVFYG